MQDTPEKTAAALSYASTPEPGGWPVGWYVGALVWAFVTIGLASFQMIKGPQDEILARFDLRVQLVFLTAAALRLVWATIRKETSP